MSFKDKLRKKFSLIRKNKYFEVNKKFFLPILKIIKKNKFKNIAIYYPSNYELNTLRLFELLTKNKNLSTHLHQVGHHEMMPYLTYLEIQTQ